MRKLVVLCAVLALAQGLSAKDMILYLKISDAMSNATIKLDSSIPAYMGSESAKNEKPFMAQVIATQKLRNAVPREHRCHNAFVMALNDLIKQAKNAGASKVVGVIGFWKSREYDSTDLFQCVVSRNTTGITLRGDFIK